MEAVPLKSNKLFFTVNNNELLMSEIPWRFLSSLMSIAVHEFSVKNSFSVSTYWHPLLELQLIETPNVIIDSNARSPGSDIESVA